MSSGPSFTRVAGGNIKPSRFVTLTAAARGKVLAAGAGAEIYGISQEGTRNTPYSTLDDGYAAIAGENIRIYGPPAKDVLLVLGGTVAAGDRLKSDADGKGVTTVTNLDEYGAIAMVDGVLNDVIPVQCVPPAQVSS